MSKIVFIIFCFNWFSSRWKNFFVSEKLFYFQLLYKIIAFNSKKKKKRNNLFCSLLWKQTEVISFLVSMLIWVDKPYLKCSFNVLLWKKWSTKISRFFAESPGFLTFFLKSSGLWLFKVGRSVSSKTFTLLICL